ncbi:MAG TPA: ATP-binding protein [Planctomycetota bacterium]|jgi:signal transduction histidine kinase|nr:ATP-binding protein [Planctomycetota bacterium]
MADPRLAYWGALAGGLAHEIKNPLSTMSISLQLLLEDLKADTAVPSSKVRPRVEMLVGEVDRLQRIVSHFLTLAKDPDLILKRCNPNDLVEAMEEFLAPEFKSRRIHVLTQLDSRVPDMLMDSDHFRQVLLNIIRNAMDAMPEGGTLTMQSRLHGNTYVLEIIDTGHGILPELLERIFDGFFSTRPGGTGIGLALSRRIIENHGGTLRCESTEGQGSRFMIELPVPEVSSPL